METNQVLPEPEKPGAELTDQFALRVWTELHRTIIAQEPGAIEGEIEAIHDMRVAIRRLRVALSNFAICLPREDRRRLRDRLEHLAASLGSVRDIDVLINTLETMRQRRPAEDQTAIETLIKRLINRRRRRHRLLINYLRSNEYGAFKMEFAAPQLAADPPLPLENIIVESPQPEEHGQAA